VSGVCGEAVASTVCAAPPAGPSSASPAAGPPAPQALACRPARHPSPAARSLDRPRRMREGKGIRGVLGCRPRQGRPGSTLHTGWHPRGGVHHARCTPLGDSRRRGVSPVEPTTCWHSGVPLRPTWWPLPLGARGCTTCRGLTPLVWLSRRWLGRVARVTAPL
jgi:hypothetical protein